VYAYSKDRYLGIHDQGGRMIGYSESNNRSVSSMNMMLTNTRIKNMFKEGIDADRRGST